MKNALQFALAVLLSGVTGFMVAQTTILNENFQGSGIPTGWTQETNASDGGWKVGTATALSSNDWPIPVHTGNIAATNDDGCGQNCNKFGDRLITPSIDLSSVTVAILRVDVFFNGGSYQGDTESAQIQISTNGGTTYTTLANLDGESDWHTVEINLTAYAGSSNVMIAFRYSDDMGWLFGWAIDNFEIFEPEQLDVQLASLDIVDVVTVSHTSPTTVDIKGTIQNMGITALTSVDVNWSVNDGPVNSQTVGLGLNYGETFDFTHSKQLSIEKPELSKLKVWLSNPNAGSQEVNLTNNELSANVTGSGGTVEKNVLVEEASGAWCGWCTMGAHVLEELRPDPNIIVVTIHGQSGGSGDDMEIPDGRTLINAYVSGFPQGFIDRKPFEVFGDPPAIGIGFSKNGSPHYASIVSEEKLEVIPAAIELSNTFNSSTREITVDISATFLGPVEGGNYRVNAYIVEDSVSGTGSGYDQVNYLSAQSTFTNGPTPGHYYYDFPPVIVGFQHMQVLRAMLGGPWGTAGVIPDSIGFNDKFEKQYTFTLPADWKEKDIFIVGVVKKYDADINKRPIVNAVEANLNSSNSTKVTLTYNPGGDTTYIESYLNEDKIFIQTYPNPANDQLNVELTMKELSNVEVKLVNLMGQEIQRLTLDDLQIGKNKLAINTSELTEGIYLLNIKSQTTEDQFTERILITH